VSLLERGCDVAKSTSEAPTESLGVRLAACIRLFRQVSISRAYLHYTIAYCGLYRTHSLTNSNDRENKKLTSADVVTKMIKSEDEKPKRKKSKPKKKR